MPDDLNFIKKNAGKLVKCVRVGFLKESKEDQLYVYQIHFAVYLNLI